MNEIETEVIEIEGKEFFLVNTVSKYSFFAEVNNVSNLYVLKEVVENGKSYLVNLDSDKELEEAFSLYHDKFGDVSL